MKFELKKTARGLTDDELLKEMSCVAQKLGKDTVTIAEYSEHGRGHASTIQRRFGSWFTALERAGLSPSRTRIGIADEELFNNLRKVWMTLGRQPSYSEAKAPLSEFSAGTYENRFGSWTEALEHFVVWVNLDAESEPNAKHEGDEAFSSPVKSTKRTKREITERMRFRILVRDGFMCRSCGASPLRTPGTELHVDHILPWSKGGETVSENLETKCLRCNLGKSNAFEI